MVKLLIFILISYGASNIVVHSSIFERFRNFLDRVSPNVFGELFSCMICFPFWWGVLMSFVVFSPAITLLGVPTIILGAFIDGCLTSGSVWLIHTIQEVMEK